MSQRRLIVITGGSSGIGYHLAAEYLKRDEKVIIIASNTEKLQEAYTNLKNISQEVDYYSCDVGDSSAVRKTVEKILTEHGCPDILVNNAGFATYRTFDQTPSDEMERLVQVNLMGVLRSTHCFMHAMMERRSGHIVNIASVSGLAPITPSAIYGAAKYALVGISHSLQYELDEFNIMVHLVCPGKVDTPFFDHETFRNRSIRKEMESFVPIEKVVGKIISAVENNRFMTIVPASFSLMIWLKNTFSFISEPIFKKIMIQRIRLLREDIERLSNNKIVK